MHLQFCNLISDSDKIVFKKMGIVDEMISHSQGQTIYTVMVKSFIQKMETWTPGRVIRLKSFSVDGVKLRLKVYPNGQDEFWEGYVSFVIENLNDFKIRLNCDYSIGCKKRFVDILTMPFAPYSNKGTSDFYDHNENHSNFNKGISPFLDEDKDFEITFTVKKVWKEFDDDEIVSHRPDPVMQSISTVKDTVTNLEKRMESVEKSIETMHKSMETLLLSQGGAPKQPRYPECPICLENMTHETRIMQCGLGHLLCQKCFDRLDYSSCPSCGKAITGRCHGMETYLKTLFDNNNE